MARPIQGQDYGDFYANYVNLATGEDAVSALQMSWGELESFINALPEARADYAYAEGKWTVKQLVQHMIDSERVFAYRALYIARGEANPLPGFDENQYAAIADVRGRSLESLKQEFLLLRRSTQMMFEGLTAADLERRGMASGFPVTVNALGFIITGHFRHHRRVMQERYGVGV